jgi:hypothetical protein
MTPTTSPAAPDSLTDIEDAAKPRSKRYTFHSVIFSGIGLSSDGYNAQVISSASLVLSRLYPHELTVDLKTRLAQAYFIGVIIGGYHGCKPKEEAGTDLMVVASHHRIALVRLHDRSLQQKGRCALCHYFIADRDRP